MTLVNQVSGGMINVEEDGIEAASRFPRVESLTCSEREKVSLDEATARIVVYFLSEWHELLPVPADHIRQGLYHDKFRDSWILEGRLGSIPKTQSSYGNREVFFFCRQESECEIRERDFHRRKEAGHEIALSEDDFVDLEVVKRA